jgi:hypothetical protein
MLIAKKKIEIDIIPDAPDYKFECGVEIVTEGRDSSDHFKKFHFIASKTSKYADLLPGPLRNIQPPSSISSII